MAVESQSPLAFTFTGAAAVTLLAVLLRLIGPWRKQISESEDRLRKALEDALDKERESHAADLERERLARAAEARQFALERDEMGDRLAKLERDLKLQNATAQAELAIARHGLKNISACFDAFLMLVKANPDKANEAIVMIEEMRAKQIVAEAEEKAIIRAAAMQAASLIEDTE